MFGCLELQLKLILKLLVFFTQGFFIKQQKKMSQRSTTLRITKFQQKAFRCEMSSFESLLHDQQKFIEVVQTVDLNDFMSVAALTMF